MKSFKLIIGGMIIFGMLLAGCSGPKKCGGGRGTRVEMGTM